MSERFESTEVPFVQIGNRRGLTAKQCVEEPWLLEFVKRFPESFEPCFEMDAMLFIEPEYRSTNSR